MTSKRIVAISMALASILTTGALASSYTVKEGDVLWRIAQNHGTTWQDLATFNNLENPHLIFPGQIINFESVAATTPEAELATDYSGTYVGYSWKGESKGVAFEDATEVIKTTLTLDKGGIITDADMQFDVYKNDMWSSRLNDVEGVSVDFSVDPTKATLANGDIEYMAGDSMFKFATYDKMANYGVAVDKDGTVALCIVDPFVRYQQEYKMAADFDFSTPIKEMTIGSGMMVPTVRTSTSAMIKPSDWAELSGNHLLNFYPITGSIVGDGVFMGLTADSTMQEYLESVGVVFVDGAPVEMEASFGYYGRGGWGGNYEEIANYLIGKSALEVTSLVDWSVEKYSANINQDNFFGLDTIAGATKTVQNSIDGIAGATVRITREATSYQRALVDAGILDESDVIKGRF